MSQETNEASFAELFNESEDTAVRHLTPGEKITATIAGIAGESIFLDVGGKSEGVLDASEMLGEDGEISVSIGDSIDVYFIQSSRAEKIFTTRVGSGKNLAHLEEAWRSGIPVEGLVAEEIKGGFSITLGGNQRAFCPYSQMGLRRVDDAGELYTGTRMTFRISRFDENGRNIVVSARAILEEEREKQKELLQQTLEEGQTVKGSISAIRDFGAFVDIGGIDGLIPISEISWSRTEDIKEVLTVDQEVTVLVKSIDWEKDRISLSLKETLANPWDTIEQTFPAGSTHTGSVVRLAPFGAFISLVPGIDGLIHISKLGGGRRINHPREVLQEGDEIEIRVEETDVENRKMSLAPADYVDKAGKEEKEKKDYKKFIAGENKVSSQAGFGTFGDLLKTKLSEKNTNG